MNSTLSTESNREISGELGGNLIPREEIRLRVVGSGDPVGRVFEWRGKVFRGIYPGRVAAVRALLEHPAISREMRSGAIQRTTITDYELEGFGMVLGCECFDHFTYDYEWSDAMLYRAALASLQLAQRLLKDGFWLNDLHTRNFTFRGSTPVYLDIGGINPNCTITFQRLRFHFASFLVDFLNRLKLGSRGQGLVGRSLAAHSGNAASYKIATGPLAVIFRRIKSRLMSIIDRSRSKSGRGVRWVETTGVASPRSGKYLWLGHLYLATLFWYANRLKPRKTTTMWLKYYEKRTRDVGYFRRKENNVRDLLSSVNPTTVLDIACNTGHFSRIALAAGHRVMAIDSNGACLDSLHTSVTAGSERDRLTIGLLSFFQLDDCTRANHYSPPSSRWRSEVVLALALAHHLVKKDGFSFYDFFAVLSRCSDGYALFEYVPFRMRGGGTILDTRAEMEKGLASFFSIIEEREIGLGRTVLWLRKI